MSRFWSFFQIAAISYLLAGVVQQYTNPSEREGGTPQSPSASSSPNQQQQVAVKNAASKAAAGHTKAVPLTMLADTISVTFGFEFARRRSDGEDVDVWSSSLIPPPPGWATSSALPRNGGGGGGGGDLPPQNFWALRRPLNAFEGSHSALINVEEVYRQNLSVRLVANITSNGRTVQRTLNLVRYAKPPALKRKLFGEDTTSSLSLAHAAGAFTLMPGDGADGEKVRDPLLSATATTPPAAALDNEVSAASSALATLSSGAGGEPSTTSAPPRPMIQKFLPSVEFTCVAEVNLFNPIPQPLEKSLDIDAHGRYFPICEFKTFWIIDSSFVELNETTATKRASEKEGERELLLAEAASLQSSTGGYLNFTIDASTTSLWKFLIFAQMDQSFAMHESFGTMGSREMEETKRIFLETNPWLLGLTFGVSMLHLLFEYLAFSNDVKFWKGRKNFQGLSLKSVLLNFYFSLVIFLYLFDGEETSWSVLAPSGIGVLIEFWKIKKTIIVTPIDGGKMNGPMNPKKAKRDCPTTSPSSTSSTEGQKEKKGEEIQRNIDDDGTDGFRVFGTWKLSFVSSYKSKTKEHDDMAMKYLMWLMIPCLIGYTIYSLVYDDHRGWYSFIIGTQVRFIYFFGFAMMTPQIFINYKMKSVTSLPWRTFVYKALNTFIDDLFAFIIKMPTMHRLACFRDDIVFFVLLYQRWIYPVDLKRTDLDDDEEEANGGEGSSSLSAAAEGVAAAGEEEKEVQASC